MGKEFIFTSGDEMQKFRILRDIDDGYISQKEGAKKLKLSARQVRRLQERVRTQGPAGVVHRLRGRWSNRRLSHSRWEQIKDLWIGTYRAASLTVTHFTEKLNEVHGIAVSAETVRKRLRAEGLIDPARKRQCAHRRERPRKERFGELIQQDTSPHDWLGNGGTQHLVVAVDDATSDPLFARLYDSDGTLPNLEAIDFICRRHGLPMAFYVDRASWFFYSGQGQKLHSHKANREARENDIATGTTQIGRALEELGIELIPAGSPQAKGRVERMNRSFQDRLISELRLRKIKSLQPANEFIETIFLPDFRQRFALEPMSSASAFVPLANTHCLDNILCVKFISTVRADNVIQKKGRYKLQLLPTLQRISWAKAKVEVRIHLDKSITVHHDKYKEPIPYEVLTPCELPRESKFGTRGGLTNVS